jgi:uncharacterized protein
MTGQPKDRLRSLPAGRAYRSHTKIKPADAQCNLDHPLCSHFRKPDLPDHRQKARMSEDVLELCTSQYIEANTGEEVVVSWQGGEPTVMGLAFFKKAVKARPVVNQ